MESILKSINHTARSFIHYRNERLRDTGLSGPQHLYIIHACQEPGIPQDRLAAHIGVNKSNVARQLAALEQAGYITRSADERDRRCLRVYPTQKAEMLCPRVLEIRREWCEQVLSEFTEEERQQLKAMLLRIADRAVELADRERGDEQ